MLGEAGGPAGLRLPEGGVESQEVLRALRGLVHSWLMIWDGEVVGLCSYMGRIEEGAVEIGYGVAPARRRLGHATLAVSALIRAASDDPRLRRLTAETAVGNAASQIVLSRNGFQQTGHRLDPDDGELILWSLDL